MGFAGFTLVMPFLPLFIRPARRQPTSGEIAMWTGLSLGITPALNALVLAPFWGRLARPLRRARSWSAVRWPPASCCSAAMALVTRPWHVLALRGALGLLTGYGALTLSRWRPNPAPVERVAWAIGTVQTAQRLGPAVGPVIGGVIARPRGPAAIVCRHGGRLRNRPLSRCSSTMNDRSGTSAHREH